MVSLKHLFFSAKADGANTTLVKPSNWNEEHKFETAGDAVILGRTVGAGPGAVQELAMSAVFSTGMVSAYAGATPPAGWFLCNGASLLRADNAALFAIIGTTYGPGSNPGSTFALPNLSGRVVAMGTPGTVAGSSTNTAVTNSSGTNNINFGNAGFVQTFGATVDQGNTIGNGTGATVPITTPNTPVSVAGYTPLNGNFGISVSGTSGAFSIVQPTLYMNYIIKA